MVYQTYKHRPLDTSYYEAVLRRGKRRETSVEEITPEPKIQEQIRKQTELEEFFRNSIDPFSMKKNYEAPSAKKIEAKTVDDVLTLIHHPVSSKPQTDH